jgi:propionate catabolism operon transcriptional regulator
MNGRTLPRKPRLCVFSYGALTRLVHAAVPEFTSRADIQVLEVVLDEALRVGREIDQSRAHDVIISAGANASLLRSALNMPVVAIKVSGYDLLKALQKARQTSDRVGLGVYKEKLPELEATKELLQVQVSQQPYETADDIIDSFRRLKQEGYRVIVGSSLVVELAEENGIVGILAYSLESIQMALEKAVQIAELAVLEAARYAKLNAVLQNLHDAVLAVDEEHRITAINPLMARILGAAAGEVVGRDLRDVAPVLSLGDLMAETDAAVDSVVMVGGRSFLMTRTALRESGQLTGALLKLTDAQAIQRADTMVRSQRKPRGLTARYRFEHISGSSPALKRALAVAERCARSMATVLITGESGTGKELFAQAIHNASLRCDRPFVALNCASFPESLLESELFGYEDGAFTGARKGGKGGLFESAHTGTIFLDEIGDMPITLQTRLLRVLQEREVVRLGSHQPIPVDLRIIAATHCCLSDRITDGSFRADLYYRLNILRLSIPPLRDRPQDIGALALKLLFSSLQRQGCSLSVDQALAPLMPILQRYEWPGNVRELENIMERFAAFLGATRSVSGIDYPAFLAEAEELGTVAVSARIALPKPEAGAGAPRAEPVFSDAWRADPDLVAADELADDGDSAHEFAPAVKLDAGTITDALARSGGNKQEAATLLGVSRTTLWRRMRDEQLL